jgi:uncharacterized protein YndB with AHSA1/START domain
MSDTAGQEAETSHELVLVNRFAATPAAVWNAWTDPAEFAAWWVAPGWTTHDVVLDVRVDGRFAAAQSADDGSLDIPFGGFYRVVEPGRRLEFTLSDAETPDADARTVLTVELRDVTGDDGPATEQEFRQTGVVTDEHFDALRAGTMLFFTQLGERLGGAA